MVETGKGACHAAVNGGTSFAYPSCPVAEDVAHLIIPALFTAYFFCSPLSDFSPQNQISTLRV